MTNTIQLPFCGFYESEASRMLENELEYIFDYSDGGGDYNIPDELWCELNLKEAQRQLVLEYVDAFQEQFESDTGIVLRGEFDGMESPKFYNFETDRIFIKVPPSTIAALFTASEADNHKTLEKVLEKRHTSYDGFHSFYSNDIGKWLLKPVGTWDHNELESLLLAVLEIYNPDYRKDYDYSVYELLDRWRGNGGPSEAVWNCLPKPFQNFADMQREYGKACSFELYALTGKAYPDGMTIEEAKAENAELPLPPCEYTLNLFERRA